MKLRRKAPSEPDRVWPLTKPLLSLTGRRGEDWSIVDSFVHALIVGATGSGKTTGSVFSLALAYMLSGFGGLVLCAKPGDAKQWKEWALRAGRASSVIVVDAEARYRLNLFDYLLSGPASRGRGLVDNIVQVLMHVLQAGQGLAEQAEGNDYWKHAMREILSNAISAIYHAHGTVTLDEVFRLIVSIPKSAEQMRDSSFQEWSFCYQTCKKLYEEPAIHLPRREAQLIATYFGQTMGQLDPKTRSNILSTVSAQLSLFQKGPLHRLFCTDTTIVPEVTHDGAIVILDLPIKEFGQTGLIAQQLFKLLWQKATERRTIRHDTRPVFLAVDECQFFMTEYDLEFLSTARSSCASALFATQNLPALRAKIGGRNPRDYADAIIGYFQTIFLHANTDATTNQWAAELIGKKPRRRYSGNWTRGSSGQTSEASNDNVSVQEGESYGRNAGTGFSYSGSGNGQFSSSFSANSGTQRGTSWSGSRSRGSSYSTSDGWSEGEGGGWSEQNDYILEPSFFLNKLRTGGPANDMLVDAVCVRANRQFLHTGACWTLVTFKQE